MKSAETDALLACTDDNDFGKKFAIATVCAMGSVFILPSILLLGYLTQVMKRAAMGRKGLPEWNTPGELALTGGVSLLALLYLLPSALLVVLSMVPNSRSFFSFSALVSRFIGCGALLAYVVGITFTITALHAYLKSRRVSDLFQIGSLQRTIMSHKAALTTLAGLAAVAVVATLGLSWALGWLGYLLGAVCTTFASLVIFYNAGRALGPTEALPELEEPAVEEEAPPTDAWIPM